MIGHERPDVPGYVLTERLGTGGTGEVWRARRAADRLVVALKVVHARDGDLGSALREAAVLSRVHHPHLLHLYDVLPLPGQDGRPTALALAVQLASGGSLAQVLADRHHLTVGELITVVAPLTGALADLHRVGVVHGDVSPGNVLFLGDGMPMLSDVGVARLVGEPVGVLHGTDGMVAPEVIEGFPPGPEADVYAVGALAWMCLTGQPPGWVGTRADLEDLAPHLSQDVRDLLQHCLAPEPEDRPDAEEVSLSVLGLGDPEPVEVAPQADAALSLTRRLRAAATEDNDEGSSPTERRGHRARARAGRPPHRFARTAEGSGRPARRRGRRAGGVIGAVVGVALVAAGVAWSGGLPGDRDTGGTPEAATSTQPTAPAPARPAPEPAPLPPPGTRATATPTPPEAAPSPSAPASPSPPVRSGLTPLVQELLDARARAWEDGDPAALAEAMVPDSPAWKADRGDLVAAQRQGVSYDGVGFSVVEVQPAQGDTDELPTWSRIEDSGASRVTVDLLVASGALEVVTPQGVRQEPATRDRVRVQLRREGGQWRLWSWSA